MPGNEEHPEKNIKGVEAVIKAAMAERSLSLRRLSELCKISPSTVSRILSGKQPASIGHLQAFSRCLHIPLENLLKAAGLEIGISTDENSEIILSLVNDVLKSYDIEFDRFIFEIRKDLKKYEQYARTAAGKDAIERDFQATIDSLNSEGVIIERLHKLHQLYLSEEHPIPIQSISGSALLYLISMPDIIPDFAFPIGYLDDAIAVVLTVKRLKEEFGILL